MAHGSIGCTGDLAQASALLLGKPEGNFTHGKKVKQELALHMAKAGARGRKRQCRRSGREPHFTTRSCENSLSLGQHQTMREPPPTLKPLPPGPTSSNGDYSSAWDLGRDRHPNCFTDSSQLCTQKSQQWQEKSHAIHPQMEMCCMWLLHGDDFVIHPPAPFAFPLRFRLINFNFLHYFIH